MTERKLLSPLPGATEAQLAYLADLCKSREGHPKVAEVKAMLSGSLSYRGFIPRQMASQAIRELEPVCPSAHQMAVGRTLAWLKECILEADGKEHVQVPQGLAEVIVRLLERKG